MTIPSLSLLREIVVDASRQGSLEEQLGCVVSHVHRAMKVSVCSVYLREEDADLLLISSLGLRAGAVGRVRLNFDEGLVGTIATTQLPLLVDRASEHPAYRYFPEAGEETFEAFLGVPIVHLGETLGVLVVQDGGSRSFTDQEESFLYTVAAQLAGVLLRWTRMAEADRAPAVQRRLHGLRGAPGFGVGTLHVVHDDLHLRVDEASVPDDPEVELARLRRGVAKTLDSLDIAAEQMRRELSEEVVSIIDFYRLMLTQDTLVASAEALVLAGASAAGALRATVLDSAAKFEALTDPFYRARAEDVRGIGNQVLRAITEGELGEAPAAAMDVVLVGDTVSVPEIARFAPERLAGIVCTEGSPYSHTAILAKALGIPAVVGTGEIKGLHEGDLVAVDGYHGTVILHPDPLVLDGFRKLIDEERALTADLAVLRDEPALTTDGFRVRLMANTGLLADATPGLERGAEGVGLYRSEIPFMTHGSFPSEDEQVEVYRRLLEIYHPRPVTIRTLDIGGDKPLPYLPYAEENPALGWRGIRFCLDNRPVFLTQLRAMLRASVGFENLRILLPMVGRVDEVVAATRLLDTAIEQLSLVGVTVSRPRVGVMVEVPAAVVLLDLIAPHVDFVSIGSNDLSQYTLAVDRNNPRVSALFDHLHPAVLRTIAGVVRECRRLELEVSVCGEMASDPLAVPLLVGLGVDTLSMSSFQLPRIKRLIRGIALSQAREWLDRALLADDESTIRQQIADALSEIGLGHLAEPGEVEPSRSTTMRSSRERQGPAADRGAGAAGDVQTES